MKFRNMAMATAALTLAAAPIAVQAAPAAPIERASAATTGESELGGSDFMRALIIILIGAIGMAALLLTDDNDSPVSP